MALSRLAIRRVLCSNRIQSYSPITASQSRQSSSSSYDTTFANLAIGSHTRVIFQGFTGRQATKDATQSLEYGTNIVGGVTPGKSGDHLGLPLFPTVRDAKEHLQPDATAVYVAAHQAVDAIEEAIAAEIPLIVAVAEHIPTVDLLRLASILRSQSKSRLVGPNSPGMISAIGKCRIGFHPIPFFQPGNVGIIHKSGTLGYETVASLTRAGLGQSLAIGMGGDPLPGTNFVDGLKFLTQHEETKGIILVGEIGGSAENEAADWIADYSKNSNSKPIAALVAGIQAPELQVMGHAGAIRGAGAFRGESDALGKLRALESAGVAVVNHPSKFGATMKGLLGSSSTRTKAPSEHKASNFGRNTQKRTLCTRSARPVHRVPLKQGLVQRRTIFLNCPQSFDLLEPYRIQQRRRVPECTKDVTVTVAIDRRRSRLCIRIGGTEPSDEPRHTLETLQQWYHDTEAVACKPRRSLGIKDIPLDVYCDAEEYASLKNGPLSEKLRALVRCFVDEGAFFVQVRFQSSSTEPRSLQPVDAHIGIDAPVFQGSKTEDAGRGAASTDEEKAAKDGIVYTKLPGDGKIGTLVNGAGLAMNTNDAISDLGGHCSNFLDTGGKATAQTVKTSFHLVLKDPNVKVLFVNIFGGLTLCDMIAEGIILAYKELKAQVPVVVRLRGTNEEKGQKLIAESGLKLLAYDDFEEAARKCIELASSG